MERTILFALMFVIGWQPLANGTNHLLHQDLCTDLAIKCATHSGSIVDRKTGGRACPKPIPMGFHAFHKLHSPPYQTRLCVAEFMTKFARSTQLLRVHHTRPSEKLP